MLGVSLLPCIFLIITIKVHLLFTTIEIVIFTFFPLILQQFATTNINLEILVDYVIFVYKSYDTNCK